jgi:molybdate transport system substrate-binding protein
MSPRGGARGPVLAVLAVALAAGGACDARPDAVVVFAAASLTDAVTEIAGRAGDATRTPVRTSFAASSTLAAQITAGAPADVFLSADTTWMDALAARGLVAPATRVEPITNHLVLIAPRDPPVARFEPTAPGAILRALGPGGRLAVGDPDFVPAGRYARRALERLGLWTELAPRLARALDVRAALALVARGETPLGVVYATDAAISDEVRVVAPLPSAPDAPIRYAFAIVAGRETPAVRRVFDWITGPEGIAIFVRQGFQRS